MDTPASGGKYANAPICAAATSAVAFGTSRAGTSSGISACRTGWSTAKAAEDSSTRTNTSQSSARSMITSTESTA